MFNTSYGIKSKGSDKGREEQTKEKLAKATLHYHHGYLQIDEVKILFMLMLLPVTTNNKSMSIFYFFFDILKTVKPNKITLGHIVVLSCKNPQGIREARSVL